MGRWARRAALAFALASGLVQAGEPVVAWQRWIGSAPPWPWLFPGNGLFGSRSAVADAAGNLFVSGTDSSTGRGLVARLDAGSGAVRWQDLRTDLPVGGVIAMGPDGNPVVAGPAVRAIAVTKYSGADGTILWRREIPPATAGANWQAARAIAVDASGAIVVRADQSSPSGRSFLVKLRADGAPAWQREDAGAFALSPDGDVFFVGPVLPGEAPGWAIARARGADGTVAWRRHQAEQGAVGLVLAVAPDGDVVASGVLRQAGTPIGTGVAPTTTSRTLKIAAADGSVRWRWARAWLPSDDEVNYVVGASTEHALAIDPQGAVFVTGQQGRDMFTRRHTADTGAVQWEARRPGVPAAGSHGMAVAVDAAGNAVVTGITGWWYSMSVPYGNVLTAAYEGGTGRLLWTVTYDGASESFDAGWDVVPAGDAVYVVASTREGTAGSGVRAWKYGPGVLPSPNYQGLWWASPAGSESGWGLGIAHQGDTLFATWFTYDDGGQPMWLVAPAMSRSGGRDYAGTVYRTSGPGYDAVRFDPSAVHTEALGSAQLLFTSDGAGTFHYTLFLSPTVANAKSITRQAFATPQPACAEGQPTSAATNFTDLWWAAPAGSESGWGLYVAHQGDVLFAVWFTYSGGSGTWFVAPDLRRGADGRWSGALLRTTGPAFRTVPWDPARVAAGTVGTASLEFADGLSGRFTWRVGESSQSKAIVRQSFALPGTDCR